MGFGLFDSESGGPVGHELTPKRKEFIEACSKNAAFYFWGVDPETDQAIVRTKDTHDEVTPIKPLPDWPYHHFLVKEWMREDVRKHIVDKPRQLMVSWYLLAWMDYNCLFRPYRRCLLNKATEGEAQFMLKDRLSVIHTHWPEWFKEWAQSSFTKEEGWIYGRTGSSIAPTGENVDDRAARGDQASIFGVDEAARHPRLREVVAALMPMAKQVILVSTPEAGTPGSTYFNEILTEEEGK